MQWKSYLRLPRNPRRPGNRLQIGEGDAGGLTRPTERQRGRRPGGRRQRRGEQSGLVRGVRRGQRQRVLPIGRADRRGRGTVVPLHFQMGI